MKYILLILAISFSLNVFADTYVKGYTRSNGTYVEPHYRSAPDSSKFNNYSSQGNSNPYNGNQGHVNPYAPPQYQYQAPQPYQYQNPYQNPYDNN